MNETRCVGKEGGATNEAERIKIRDLPQHRTATAAMQVYDTVKWFEGRLYSILMMMEMYAIIVLLYRLWMIMKINRRWAIGFSTVVARHQ